MGAELSRKLDCDHDLPNVISGLTAKDIHNIQHSWATVYAHQEQNGMELFRRLFRADPEIKHLFKNFRHLDEEQLSISPQFRAHVLLFMGTFNSVIENLDKPEIAVAMLHKLGHQHKKHHVQRKHFDTLDKVLTEYLSKDLKASHSVLASWSRLVDGFMFPHVFKTLHSNG